MTDIIEDLDRLVRLKHIPEAGRALTEIIKLRGDKEALTDMLRLVNEVLVSNGRFRELHKQINEALIEHGDIG